MKRLLAALLVLSVGNGSWADDVVFQFDGYVDSMSEDFTSSIVLLNTAVCGQITFDASAPAGSTASENGATFTYYPEGLKSLSIEVPTLDGPPLQLAIGGGTIVTGIFDGAVFQELKDLFELTGVAQHDPVEGVPVPELRLFLIDLFWDQPGATNDLPHGLPWGQFQYGSFSMARALSDSYLNGAITSVCLVPEPSSAALAAFAGAVLIGVAFRARARRYRPKKVMN